MYLEVEVLTGSVATTEDQQVTTTDAKTVLNPLNNVVCVCERETERARVGE